MIIILFSTSVAVWPAQWISPQRLPRHRPLHNHSTHYRGSQKKRVISVVFSIIILYLYKSQFWYIRHHLKILGGFWKKEGMTIKRWFFACEFKIMYCNCKIQFYENPLKMRARAFWRNMLHEMNLNLLQDAFQHVIPEKFCETLKLKQLLN